MKRPYMKPVVSELGDLIGSAGNSCSSFGIMACIPTGNN